MESQQQLVVLQIFFDYNVKSVLSFHRLLVVVAFSRHPLSHKGEQYNKNFHVLIHIISLFLSPFSPFRIHATFFFFFFLSLSFKFLKKSLSSSARRSRLRPLRRGVRHVRHNRVDNRLRLPHRLRVRRCIRTKTGDNHQR